MKAAKYVFGLACLFVVSCAAIVYGYYNDILGFRISVSLAFQELPILAAAMFMTLSCPISHIIAFRKFPDDYGEFAIVGMAIGCLLPIVLFVFLLPSAGEQPEPLLDDHLIAMYMLLWGSFYGVYHWLHLDFWRFARREI